MTQQTLVLITFLIVTGVLVLVFQMVFASTKHATDIAPARVNRYRTLWFLTLAFILGVVFLFTIRRSPYSLFAQERPDKIFAVAAQQFAFVLSDESFEREKPSAEASGGTVLPVGALVEFRVTSRDVNHGFGIFDPDRTLIAQVQAMPGYVNRLRLRFDKPGTYNVLCLEYCGIAHFIMRTSVEVK
ncbi:cytochrome C oxidase subunit II [Candidatus Methylomirabilis lanthanidiphila]|uniref:Cytochrome C oxidase subunit II n=1 Tax=Candidatus Methylomirabilis lanthanidiphila TaxID=2211376 RepID=A0A564ZLD1_9BACT|nr:hypothetical protein [Candidatus Methylomirabilis lanthanidiphila]VUZ85983.1 cytochrome C oxidase subunit II [Candidatus Methylomirabilis lanthanidiphila]